MTSERPDQQYQATHPMRVGGAVHEVIENFGHAEPAAMVLKLVDAADQDAAAQGGSPVQEPSEETRPHPLLEDYVIERRWVNRKIEERYLSVTEAAAMPRFRPGEGRRKRVHYNDADHDFFRALMERTGVPTPYREIAKAARGDDDEASRQKLTQAIMKFVKDPAIGAAADDGGGILYRSGNYAQSRVWLDEPGQSAKQKLAEFPLSKDPNAPKRTHQKKNSHRSAFVGTAFTPVGKDEDWGLTHNGEWLPFSPLQLEVAHRIVARPTSKTTFGYVLQEINRERQGECIQPQELLSAVRGITAICNMYKVPGWHAYKALLHTVTGSKRVLMLSIDRELKKEDKAKKEG